MRLLVSGATAYAHSWYDEEPARVGQLVCPRSRNYVWAPYWAADNAAFSGFNADAYVRMLKQYAGIPGCRFVAVPDVVCDAYATLQSWWKWWRRVKSYGYPLAFVLQDGFDTVGVPWDLCDAIFIGGSTPFKYSPAVVEAVWDAHRLNRWVHMGRVNTVERLCWAEAIGCDSVDGTGFSRYSPKMWPRFRRATRIARHVEATLDRLDRRGQPDTYRRLRHLGSAA